MQRLLASIVILTGCGSSSASSDERRTEPAKPIDRGPSHYHLRPSQVDSAREAAARHLSCATGEPKEFCALLRVAVDVGGILSEHARETCKREDKDGWVVCADTNASTACPALATTLETYAREHPDAVADALARARDQPSSVADFGRRYDAVFGAVLDMGQMLTSRCKKEPRVPKAFTKLGFWGFE